MSALRVTVLQPAARLGLKGPDAAALLQQAGISVPAVAHRMLLSAPPGFTQRRSFFSTASGWWRCSSTIHPAIRSNWAGALWGLSQLGY